MYVSPSGFVSPVMLQVARISTRQLSFMRTGVVFIRMGLYTCSVGRVNGDKFSLLLWLGVRIPNVTRGIFSHLE